MNKYVSNVRAKRRDNSRYLSFRNIYLHGFFPSLQQDVIKVYVILSFRNLKYERLGILLFYRIRIIRG